MRARLTLSLVAALVGGCGGEEDPCPAGETDCSGYCRDLTVDLFNCGSCGNFCGDTQSCVEGACVCGGPELPDSMTCGGECVDTSADPEHCGGCDPCPVDAPQCFAGVCSRCAYRWQTDCGGTCFDLSRSHDHCGDCAVACSGSAVCSGGECVEGTGADCASPCDVAAGELCCALETGDECVPVGSRLHCGACDIACDEGLVCGQSGCEPPE